MSSIILSHNVVNAYIYGIWYWHSKHDLRSVLLHPSLDAKHCTLSSLEGSFLANKSVNIS